MFPNWKALAPVLPHLSPREFVFHILVCQYLLFHVRSTYFFPHSPFALTPAAVASAAAATALVSNFWIDWRQTASSAVWVCLGYQSLNYANVIFIFEKFRRYTQSNENIENSSRCVHSTAEKNNMQRQKKRTSTIINRMIKEWRERERMGERLEAPYRTERMIEQETGWMEIGMSCIIYIQCEKRVNILLNSNILTNLSCRPQSHAVDTIHR